MTSPSRERKRDQPAPALKTEPPGRFQPLSPLPGRKQGPEHVRNLIQDWCS
ncbi:hypothetical protein I5Q34_14865 [Streptomyces sp. AV19]|uniref:hypothetical protein n=1 Tax=Streptomyces sp. AV19 TaxID=2793068 RepID=UPI0018FE9E51|nr:hypothetical protein [Streptomyces sp. AV19]MBH1935539.1 hypothetical protein [Streptomyces sp. AV19]MDG4534428.1 hypothetical protein [Streptomyces sp. AV19]